MFGMSRKAIFLAVTLSGLVAKKSVTAEPNVKTTDAILETPPMVAGIRKNQTNPLMHAIYDAHANGKDHGSDVRRLANEENEPVTDLDNALHLQWKDDDRLLVEVASTTEAADISLRHHLEEYGFETTACAKYVCSGYLDIALLPEVEQLPSVLSIKPSMSIAWGLLRGEEFGRRKVEEVDASPFGSIKSHAFEALQVDKLRAAYPHLTGTGMKIGVLSDSYNTKGGADDDIASGDLPPNVVVVKEAPRRRKDEGRAILQLIHDLAPDAELYFRATEGFVDFAAGINELADLGCDVIIDDILNPGQPFFQEGLVAQTASDVAEIRGIPYFSAAGNSGRTSYESQYQATACGINNQMEDYKSCHDFGGGNTLQEIQVSEIACFVLQWDDPFATVSGPSSGGAKTDIDVLLVDPETREFADWMSADINQGMDPLEYWCFPPGTYHIAFALFDGPAPNLIKWATPDDDNVVSVNPPPNSGYITSQANTPHTAGVGAAFELQIFSELQLEPFSSAGGTPLLFDRDGSRKAKPLIPQQPRFVGPDGSYNTFFGVNFTDPLEEMDDRWRFFGTSASAPNVAAVALLVLQAVPDLPPSRVYEILEATAIDMNQVGFDYDSGHGFVNALAAVEMALSEAGGMGDDDGDDDGKKKKQKKTKDEDGSDVSTPSQCSFTFGDVDVEILMGDAALETRSHGGKKKLKSN